MSPNPDWPVPPPEDQAPPTPDTRDPGDVTVPEDEQQPPLPEDAPGGRDSTIFSPAFDFVEWRSYLAQSGEQSPDLEVKSVWSNDEWPDSPCFPVREKWVYLFRQYRGEFDLAAECYVDSEGLIHTADLESAKSLEAGDRPKPAPGNRQVCLAHTINGKPAYYSGYASRVRMPIDALNMLLADKGILLNALDLRALDYDFGARDKISADRLFLHQGQWRFGVVDPLTVASDLGRRYRIARSELVAFFAPPTTDHSDEERRKIYERESKYLIGKVLAQIVEKDPYDSNKLGALIKPTGGKSGVEVITKYVRTHESKQRALVMNADLAAALTCNWLTNELMDIARTAHFHNMKKNGGEYLRVYGRASEQLIESDPGRAMFADFLATPDHWVLPIALPQSALASNVLAAVQASAGFAFSLGEQLAASYLKNTPGSKIEEVAESLAHLVDGKLFKTVDISFRPKLPDGQYGPKLTAQEIVVLEEGKSKLAEFFKEGSTAQKMQSRLLYTASLLSWISGIKALKDGGYEKLTPATVLATFASTVDIAGSTIGMFVEIGTRYAAIFGVVSGVVAVATALKDIKGAAGRNDYGSVVGYTVGATGATLSLMSSFLIVAGVKTAMTGVGLTVGTIIGLTGAVLAILSPIIVALSGHSDLQVFVHHCAFGKRYGSGGVTTWSNGHAMEAWRAHPSLQITALYSLLTSFTVASVSRWEAKAKINFGMVQAQSIFHVEFTTTYKGRPEPVVSEITFRVGKKEVRTVRGPQLSDAETVSTWPSEGAYAILGGYNASLPKHDMRTSKCVAWLDYEGDGQRFYPMKVADRPKAELADVPLD